jgi:hypothetical protein
MFVTYGGSGYLNPAFPACSTHHSGGFRQMWGSVPSWGIFSCAGSNATVKKNLFRPTLNISANTLGTFSSGTCSRTSVQVTMSNVSSLKGMSSAEATEQNLSTPHFFHVSTAGEAKSIPYASIPLISR